MIIRSVSPIEVRTLQDLNDKIFTDNPKYDSDLKTDWTYSNSGEKYFTSIIDNKDSICLIAEINNKPIGYINAYPKDFDHRLKKYIEIENLGVLPEYRSEGVGAKLMEECLKIAKIRGFEAVYVSSYYDNKKAISFYEKSGFKRIDLNLEKDL